MEPITASVPAGCGLGERLRRGLLAFFGFVTEHRDGWTGLGRSGS